MPTPEAYPRWRGGCFAEGGDRQAEQTCALGDIGGVVVGDPVLHGPPRVGADRVGLHQRGNGVDVVGARQRERAPPVAAGHQPRCTAGRDPARRRQTEQCGAAGEDFFGVDGDAGERAKRIGHPPGLRQHGDGEDQRRHMIIVLFLREQT